MKDKDIQSEFDIIVIGGGATGSGIALDATLRGLKTLLVEKNDFSEGTSSRSTKLVHGGVRYLEKAVKKLDFNQYALVKEGLKERYRLLKNAPHLSRAITLVTPLYKWYEIPYMYVGLVLYDIISGKRRLGKSSIVSKKEIIKKFPSVSRDGLKGGVRYFDGAFNDSRMVISILQSAKESGCEVKNYTEVTGFKYVDEKISGVKLKDSITLEEYEANASIIVNATGPFCDGIRKLDFKEAKDIVKTSSGIHIVLDKKFLPNDEGLMIPKTEDGRVLFMLPYLGKCLVGTTDEIAKVQERPNVSEADIEYLLRHIKKYFAVTIKKSDILSSWSGLRPLVVDDNAENSQEIVREHSINSSKSGLISVVGGKWTTYRKMAEETLDFALKIENKKNLHSCQTKNYKLVGSIEKISKIKEKLGKFSFNKDLNEHLISFYGDCALEVFKYIEKFGEVKLHDDYPYLEAEVYYSIDYEFTKKPLDFLVRRLGLGLVDKQAAIDCVHKVSLIYKDIFNWTQEEYSMYLEESKTILNTNL